MAIGIDDINPVSLLRVALKINGPIVRESLERVIIRNRIFHGGGDGRMRERPRR